MPDSDAASPAFPPAARAGFRTLSPFFSPTHFHEDPVFYLVAQKTFAGEPERRLLSQDFDALPPALDPQQIVGDARVAKTGQALNMPEGDVRRAYEKCATVLWSEFGIELQLTWK